MKTVIFFLLFLCFIITGARADHITGGEMFYSFVRESNGVFTYRATLKLFMRCNSGREFNNPIIIGVFDKASNTRIQDISVALSRTETLDLRQFSPCITNPPKVCYNVGYYEYEISLPSSRDGYTLAAQVVFRIEGINNLIANYGNIGATYTAEIPGTLMAPEGPKNNSARFTGDDLVAVCSNNSFSYSFGASDADQDKLRFSFCNAYQGGSGGFGNNSNPPQSPPYYSVPYSNSFGGSAPLGNNVHIDPATGLITGIAPVDGIYVVTVCVEEMRGDEVVAVQRKDIQINVSGCSIASASLPDEYMLCDDTRSISVSNFSSSPLITSYNWDFINAEGDILFSSENRTAAYTFPTEGNYTIKLVVNRNGLCADSITSLARVFPGFAPDFTFLGICMDKPTNFTDATTSILGRVNGWNWNFDRNGNQGSAEQNPMHTYAAKGPKNVQLIVTNTVGCRDTVTKTIDIVDKPPISLAFRDTLICIPDNVQLKAEGQGNFTWSPGLNMADANTQTPTVSPVLTTKYYVDLDDNGCLNRDSVLVNVVDHVSLSAMADTLICEGDTVQLRLVTDGLRFAWTPAVQFLRNDIQNPSAITPSTTRYEVTANIGTCSATEDIVVSTVPYPLANAGADTLICFNTFAQLTGATDGSSYSWSPAGSLSNRSILDPVAKPVATTPYILTAFDTKGCPKPSYDTMLVNVLPMINPFAGRDTAIIVGQSLQMQASGGIRYVWSPTLGMNNNTIVNPLVVHRVATPGISYKVLAYNEAGCVDSAQVRVKVFNTLPSIFVPNAFTPNGDGKNDRLTFIAAGMQTIDYFQVYNRYGQLVFSANSDRAQWDGMVGSVKQASGTFVWMVKAMDYNGSPYFKKGTVTLIR